MRFTATPRKRAVAVGALTESTLAGRLIWMVFAATVVVFLIAVLAL